MLDQALVRRSVGENLGSSVRVPVGGTLSVPLPVGGSLCDHALMSEDEETTRVGMTSRRLLMAQGLVMTSATLLAACGSGSASSTTTPAPRSEEHTSELQSLR